MKSHETKTKTCPRRLTAVDVVSFSRFPPSHHPLRSLITRVDYATNKRDGWGRVSLFGEYLFGRPIITFDFRTIKSVNQNWSFHELRFSWYEESREDVLEEYNAFSERWKRGFKYENRPATIQIGQAKAARKFGQ